MNNALQVGAQQFNGVGSSDWRSMDAAPRDGTPIEIKCSYGVAPHYNVYRWADYGLGKKQWVVATNSAMALASDSKCTWRPYAGDVAAYVDPTGGMQNDPAYWRGAVARKYGLPLDHFEKEAARNERRNAGVKWWQFWK